MTDRELLEHAAKAAGLRIDKSLTSGGGAHNTGFDSQGNAVLDWHNGTTWNPLADDGDALRLAVKLRMQIDILERSVRVLASSGATIYEDGTPDAAATRRAIVRAAAAIGGSETAPA